MITISHMSRPMAWLRRYLPAEAVSMPVTVLATLATLELSGSLLLAAVVGTWSECLAYYAVIVWRELRARRCATLAGALGAVRDLLLEFGPAELLDSALVRPAAIAAALALIPAPALGAVVGKLLADALFYLPTIVSYELLRLRGRAADDTARG